MVSYYISWLSPFVDLRAVEWGAFRAGTFVFGAIVLGVVVLLLSTCADVGTNYCFVFVSAFRVEAHPEVVWVWLGCCGAGDANGVDLSVLYGVSCEIIFTLTLFWGNLVVLEGYSGQRMLFWGWRLWFTFAPICLQIIGACGDIVRWERPDGGVKE